MFYGHKIMYSTINFPTCWQAGRQAVKARQELVCRVDVIMYVLVVVVVVVFVVVVICCSLSYACFNLNVN